MSQFIINGGKKLKGKIKTNSAKNSAVAVMCACAMIKGRSTLLNAPVIEEVKRIMEVLNSIGISARWVGEKKLEIINKGKIDVKKLNQEAFNKTRSGLLLLAPLAHSLKNFSLPRSTGCNLGKRTVSAHILSLEKFGIKISEDEKSYTISRGNLKSADFTMYESGDTATENAVMAACLAKGKTEINFASCNYMVQDLSCFLNRAGAKISGFDHFNIKIKGVEKLKPVKDYPVMPDPIESMTFISIAITTCSRLKIIGCPMDFLRLEIEKLKVMGQKIKISRTYKSLNKFFNLADIEIIPSKLSALPEKIYGRPYPGLNMDNLPLFVPILTQAHGQTLVHDWCYENRAIYYTELNRLGANIMLHDPHRVTVIGPAKLRPAEVICPPALRPSINLLTCMLAAPGKSILRNAYAIDRGYENIVDRLKAIGADIERMEE